MEAPPTERDVEELLKKARLELDRGISALIDAQMAAELLLDKRVLQLLEGRVGLEELERAARLYLVASKLAQLFKSAIGEWLSIEQVCGEGGSAECIAEALRARMLEIQSNASLTAIPEILDAYREALKRLHLNES